MSNPSEINAQQRKMQEQQQKMWQDNLRRQQMYVYYKGQQQKRPEAKKVSSCDVCGSVLLIKSCPFCRKFFCNTHLSSVKFMSNGHECAGRKLIQTRPSKPQIPPKTPTKKSTENNETEKNEQDKELEWLDRVIEDDDFDFES